MAFLTQDISALDTTIQVNTTTTPRKREKRTPHENPSVEPSLDVLRCKAMPAWGGSGGVMDVMADS